MKDTFQIRVCFIFREVYGEEPVMQKKILIYNNTTGIADRIEPLLMGEKMEVLVAESARFEQGSCRKRRFICYWWIWNWRTRDGIRELK